MQGRILIIFAFFTIILFIQNSCSAEDWCDKAENDKLKTAIDYFDKCIASKCPGSKCDCLINNGKSMLEKRPELAKKYFEYSVASCSDKPQSLYMWATACAKSGDPSTKKTICSQLKKDYPQFHEDDKMCSSNPTPPHEITIPSDMIIRKSKTIRLESHLRIDLNNGSLPVDYTDIWRHDSWNISRN